MSIIGNINGGYCNEVTISSKSEHRCHMTLAHQMSLANTKDHPERAEIQSTLCLTVTVLLMIFLIYFRYKQRSINSEIDVSNVTPSDYTVLIRNVPLNLSVDY